MNVLMFSPYAGWCPSFEYELEIMQNHLDAGDSVTIAVCNADLPTCDYNLPHALKECFHCVGRRLFGLSQLSKPIRQIPIVSSHWLRGHAKQLPRHWNDLNSLKEFRVGNFELGLSALSSLITALREPSPDLRDRQTARLLYQFALSGLSVYFSLLETLQKHPFDSVYLVNGRLAIFRAVVRACEAAGVDSYTHERGWNLEHFSVHKNTLIHDLVYLERLILDTWQAADPSSRETLAKDYYDRRAEGEGFNWQSFVEGQQAELLPENWDPNLTNISLFTSSDDEIAALGKLWSGGPIYTDQVSGVVELAQKFSQLPGKHLYIRVHPHQGGTDNSTLRRLKAINFPQVTVISPESPVSSYALLKNSAKVITFHSRMGIEATYWDKPSVLLGRTPYRNLGSTYNPESETELFELLSRNLEAKPKLGALQYGYYFRTYGRRAKYFELTGYCEGKYRSVELRKTGLFTALAEFASSNQRISGLLSELSNSLNCLRIGGSPF